MSEDSLEHRDEATVRQVVAIEPHLGARGVALEGGKNTVPLQIGRGVLPNLVLLGECPGMGPKKRFGPDGGPRGPRSLGGGVQSLLAPSVRPGKSERSVDTLQPTADALHLTIHQSVDKADHAAFAALIQRSGTVRLFSVRRRLLGCD